MQEKEAQPYGFDPEWERALVALLCTRPKFFGRIGAELDAECMDLPASQLAVGACQEIAKETGSGPSTMLTVVQFLRRRMEAGSVTRDEIAAVNDLVDEAEDAGLPTEQEALQLVVPVLRRRMQYDAIRMAHSNYGSDKPMDRVMSMLDRAASLGRNDASLGVKVGGSSFEAIEALRRLERLPLGVDELDSDLGGGVPRGTLSMFMGGSGDGKSMALSHVAAFASRAGMFVVYATLELPEAYVLARIKANHTGETIDSIVLGNPSARKKLVDNPPRGPCYVKEFAPQVTTNSDIQQWIVECEAAEGRPVDVVIVDYADKMTETSKDKSTYKVMELVYERLRTYVFSTKKWGFTASQTQRGDQRKSSRPADLDDVADSVNKVRVVDLVITLNLDDGQMLYNIAKNRYGAAKQTVGPLPVDFSRAAIAPVSNYGPSDLLAKETEFALSEEILDL